MISYAEYDRNMKDAKIVTIALSRSAAGNIFSRNRGNKDARGTGENRRNCLDKNKIWEESPMKKSLVLAMAMALGVSATAFAANPFSDLPAGHWA